MLKIDISYNDNRDLKAIVTITGEEFIEHWQEFSQIVAPETKLVKSGEIIHIPGGVDFERFDSIQIERDISAQIEILRKMAAIIESSARTPKRIAIAIADLQPEQEKQ